MTIIAGPSEAAKSANKAKSASLSARPSVRNNSSAWSIAMTNAGGRSVSSPNPRRNVVAWTCSSNSGRSAVAPACTAERKSARECLNSIALIAFTRPVSPVRAARSGRITGKGMNSASSRCNLGRRPARRNDDLPAPEAPRIANNRGGAPALSPRS
jgi:hypothetical protein